MDTTSRNVKVRLAGGVATAIALAIAVGAAGAVAASRAFSAHDESQAVIEDAAGQLGIEPGALAEALKQALGNRVDRAVEDGRLSEEHGARLKERIESGEVPLVLGGLRHERFGPGPGHPHLGFGGLDTAASYLGLDESELRARLRAGETLAELATAEGKSVAGLVDALVADAKERIDDAVSGGAITSERAAELKDGLEERVTGLVKGELRPRGFGPGHRFGHGFGAFGGAPAFRGPRA